MVDSKSFSRDLFCETKVDACHTCSRKFRSGDRHRYIEVNVTVTVCAACHQRHVRSLCANSDSKDNSVMDMDMVKDRVVFDVTTQTDFDFVGQEAIFPVTATPSSIMESGSVSTESGVDTIRLPFFRISKSSNRCPICSKYFIESNHSCRKICDSVRSSSLINHHIFIPENSRCCSTHLDVTDFKLSAFDLIKKNYDKTCLIKINELMQVLENLKAELNKHVSYWKSTICFFKEI
jgi:hypothetical protein